MLHQAAMCSVPGSIQDPVAAHEINVTGTLNLLIAAGIAAFALIYASSSAVYGDSSGLPKREPSLATSSRPMAPRNTSTNSMPMYSAIVIP